MSTYSAELRGILWQKGELTSQQVTALALRCPGDYARPDGSILVYEVAWLMANKVCKAFGGSTQGIQDLLRLSNHQRAHNWESTNIRELVGVTVTGSKLRDYQLQGVEALTRSSMVLGDEQGLGKTIQALAAQHACLLRELRGTRMLVVVSSAEMADEWRIMAKEHLGKEVYHIKSPECITKRPTRMSEAPIWVIMYAKFWRPHYLETLKAFLEAGDNILAFDEAHRLSGYLSQQHAGARELLQLAWRTWFFTGTQVTNGVDSYHAIYTLATGSGIKREEWIRYFAMGTVNPNKPLVQQSWDYEKLESLARIHPLFGLRRLKKDVLTSLPPIIGPIEVEIPMDTDHAALYAQLKHLHEVELEGEAGRHLMEVDPDQFFVKALRLYQMATHPVLLGETKVQPKAKLEVLCNLIREAGDQKVLVWGHFPAALDWLAVELSKRFPDKTVEVAHGGVSRTQRVAIKNLHQSGKVDIMVANPMVWAEGLNLTNASVAIYWDLHPSRILWNQSKDRIHRWGQLLPVTIYWLAYTATVQVSTMRNMKGKDRIANIITGDVRTGKFEKDPTVSEASQHVKAQFIKNLLINSRS